MVLQRHTATALSQVVESTNYGNPPGHICETSIRLADGDDRMIWLVLNYDDTVVLGAFAAPSASSPTADSWAITAQAHAVHALADPALRALAEERDGALADRIARKRRASQ